MESEAYLTDAERADGGHGWNAAEGKPEGPSPSYSWCYNGFEQTDDHPVGNVTWNDAMAFCGWLSRIEKVVYRLPTEAEWEYACRAGTSSIYTNGNDPEGLVKVGNVWDEELRKKYPDLVNTRHKGQPLKASDGYVYTAPVGQFQPNAFGLYDMLGNVWEWCNDWFDTDYRNPNPVVDPTGPLRTVFRVARGGASWVPAWAVRPAFRIDIHPNYSGDRLGFRVVREHPRDTSLSPGGSGGSPASAIENPAGPEPGKSYRLVNVQTGKALDVLGSSRESTDLVQHDVADSESQYWTFEKRGNYYFIRNVNSGLDINVPADKRDNGLGLIQYRYGGWPNELWELKPDGESFQIVSFRRLAIAVTAGSQPGARVVQVNPSGGNYERWKLLAVDRQARAAAPAPTAPPSDSGMGAMMASMMRQMQSATTPASAGRAARRVSVERRGVSLSKAPAVAVPGSDLDRVATGRWVRLLDSKTVLSDPQKMQFQNGILELDNTRMLFPKINARDVILRARVRKVSGQNLSIGLRSGAGETWAHFSMELIFLKETGSASGGDSAVLGAMAIRLLGRIWPLYILGERSSLTNLSRWHLQRLGTR